MKINLTKTGVDQHVDLPPCMHEPNDTIISKNCTVVKSKSD